MQLDANGLVIDTVDEILADLEIRVRDALGQEIETGPTSPLGQILGIFANALRLNQEGIAAAYSAYYRGSASGVNLARVGSLTGSGRLGATPSRVVVQVTTAAPVNLAPGELVAHVIDQPDRLFENATTIIQGGPAIGSWLFISQDVGPIEAPIGTLTVIPVPVVDITAVTNPVDAILGDAIETDTAYRARQEQELSRPASATVDGIRVDVLDAVVNESGMMLIDDLRVFENTADVVVDGRPPHSLEVVIWDPLNAPDVQVGQAVWDSKPGGILAFGSIPTIATDSRGDPRDSAFSRATERVLVFVIDITSGPEYSTGADSTESRIKSGILAYWAMTQRIGQDLIRSQLYEPIWDSVEKNAEVVDILEIRASISPALPSAANIAIGDLEIGTINVINIAINEIP